MKIRLFIFLFFLLNSLSSFSQFQRAEIGVDGLTCSLCSYGVEKALRRLDFVQDVKMDLNENIAYITFDENKKTDMKKLTEQVLRAGFSVRYTYAYFNFDGVKVNSGYIYNFQDKKYAFIETGERTLRGETKLIFLNKSMISEKEFKKWKNKVRGDSNYFITL